MNKISTYYWFLQLFRQKALKHWRDTDVHILTKYLLKNHGISENTENTFLNHILGHLHFQIRQALEYLWDPQYCISVPLKSVFFLSSALFISDHYHVQVSSLTPSWSTHTHRKSNESSLPHRISKNIFLSLAETEMLLFCVQIFPHTIRMLLTQGTDLPWNTVCDANIRLIPCQI